MKRAATWSVLLFVSLAACSGGDLLVEIDLQSFVTESGTLADPAVDYALLTLPVPVDVTGLELLAPVSVELVEVIDDVTEIRSVLFSYALQAVHREGDARAVVRLRLAGTQSGLGAASALIDTLVLDLRASTDTTVATSIDLPSEKVALFRGGELWLAAEGDLRVEAAAAPGDSVAGRIWLRAMAARVAADPDFF